MLMSVKKSKLFTYMLTPNLWHHLFSSTHPPASSAKSSLYANGQSFAACAAVLAHGINEFAKNSSWNYTKYTV